MNWLKLIYELVGASFPRLSIAMAATLGALVFGGAWWLVGRQYYKDHPIMREPSAASSGAASSSQAPAANKPAAVPLPDARLLVRSIPPGCDVYVASASELGIELSEPSDARLKTPHLLQLFGTNRLCHHSAVLTNLVRVATGPKHRGVTPIEISVARDTYIVFVTLPEPQRASISSLGERSVSALAEFEDDSIHGPAINASVGDAVGRLYVVDLRSDRQELVQLWQPKTASLADLDKLYPRTWEFFFDEIELSLLLRANVPASDVITIIRLLKRGGEIAYRQDAEHRLLIQADKETKKGTTVLRYRGNLLAQIRSPQ